MSDVKRFRFVSPGIFINEIDQSQIPALPARMGPVIIGRSRKGPGFRPVTCNSFAEFVETFGKPVPGGANDDVWRNGNTTATTYAAYAAQAYLRHSNPVTFVRLLGSQHPQHSNTAQGKEAGWKTQYSEGSQGGAYGLFIINSASYCRGNPAVSPNNDYAGAPFPTGTLAAVWYVDSGTIELSGAIRGSDQNRDTGYGTGAGAQYVSGNAVLLGNVGDNEWKVVIKNYNAEPDNRTVEKIASFNFDRSSEKYIRNVFNTNPNLVNGDVHSTTTNYWLGESFERDVERLQLSSSANSAWGIMLPLASGSYGYDDQTKEAIPSETGWFISQDIVSKEQASTFEPENRERSKKLFKFVSIDGGSEWNQNNLKISLRDIRPAKDQKNWPTFTVEIRAITDTDKNTSVIERYSNCNLNVGSPNYIGRKIGDKELVYDTTERRNIEVGNYPNKSKYVRVETNEAVYSRELLPFGCYGPPRYKSFVITSGTSAPTVAKSGIQASASINPDNAPSADYNRFVKGASSIDGGFVPQGYGGPDTLTAYGAYTGEHPFTGTFEFPSVPLRVSASHGGIIDYKKAYFGADTTRYTSTDVRYEGSISDVLRTKPEQTSASNLDFAGNSNAEYSWVFTLDDVVYDDYTGDFHYSSGSRKAGTSATAQSGSNWLLTASAAGVGRFSTVLYGGFDGFDIREREPFNDTRALTADDNETESYAVYSVHKALDVVQDPERVECNLMAMPGIKNVELTNRLVDVCEERGDALAIIDLKHDYVPDTENTNNASSRRGNVDEAAAALKDREINSSYGCCYFPWVQVVDTFDSSIRWVPPSVVALGAMAYSESVKEVWFAPAGFSRGGLTATQAGGLPVVGVNQQLTSKQRDTLYEVGINPIAQFPAEGIVIFGQKTLQAEASALDRINVRRLLLFLKKEVSRIASTTLFEQNVEATWNAFKGEVDTLLSSVKARLGLTDYKIVLDETTTTPDLVDRNILYAKIFLKPARAIEFIALDFFITRSGASFED